MIQNYDALTVGKYEAIMRVQREHGEDDTNGRNLAILSILSDLSTDELLDMKVPKFRAMMDDAIFLRRPLRPAPVLKSYKLGNMVLRPAADLQKMTTAQYIDFQTLAKASDDRIAELLSCFLLPEGHRYNTDYDIAEVQRAIREFLPINAAHGLLAFFLDKSHRSMLNTLRCSVKTLKRANRKKKDPRITAAMMDLNIAILSLRNGVGFRMSTPLLK